MLGTGEKKGGERKTGKAHREPAASGRLPVVSEGRTAAVGGWMADVVHHKETKVTSNDDGRPGERSRGREISQQAVWTSHQMPKGKG